MRLTGGVLGETVTDWVRLTGGVLGETYRWGDG